MSNGDNTNLIEVNMGEVMTKLQELRDALAEKKEHENDARLRAIKIAKGISDGFREYLGLPHVWEDMERRKRPYTQFFEYDEKGNDRVDPYNHKPIQEVIEISYTNEIRFKMGVILDMNVGAHPKQLYTFNVRSNLYGSTLYIDFSDFGDAQCTIPEGTDWYDFTPAFEKLYSIILSHLNQRIGDANNQRHVGFQVTQV